MHASKFRITTWMREGLIQADWTEYCDNEIARIHFGYELTSESIADYYSATFIRDSAIYFFTFIR